MAGSLIKKLTTTPNDVLNDTHKLAILSADGSGGEDCFGEVEDDFDVASVSVGTNNRQLNTHTQQCAT